MITASDLISRAEQIVSENPSYRSGGSGTDGTCDCIGLIIGAIRRAGGSWPGIHGSNYAARKETDYLLPLSGTGDLKPGEIVFKAREPGKSGYSLPSRYKKGGKYYNGDLRDYYHIGLVESAAPLRIRHMTSPRAKMDRTLGKWAFHGKLKRTAFGNSSPEDVKNKITEPPKEERKK